MTMTMCKSNSKRQRHTVWFFFFLFLVRSPTGQQWTAQGGGDFSRPLAAHRFRGRTGAASGDIWEDLGGAHSAEWKVGVWPGFAFATFYDSNVARAVVRNLTNKPLPGHDGVNFSISLSKPHSLVMIKNLPKHKSRAQITRDFEGFFEGMLGVNIWGIEGKPPVLWASLVSGMFFISHFVCISPFWPR